MDRPGWAPDDVDIDRPSVARVYDYFLGGSHNFAADRVFAEEALRMMPAVTTIAQENRAFLRRALAFLCDQGVRQFVDLGSGIPTVGNVHEVVQARHPDARTVYVDIDPVAYAHSRAILAGDPHATVIRADLRRPADVLADPELRRYVDLDQPVGILLVGVLHFVPDEERPADVVAGYVRAVAPGSHVVVSHASAEGRTEESDEVVRLYAKAASSLIVRTAEEVTGLLSGLTVVAPGAVTLSRWRPEQPAVVPPNDLPGVGVVGRRD